MTDPTTVEQYLDALADPAREPTAEVVRRVRLAAPDAEESIAYDMADFRLANGHHVYVAGWKAHVSLHGVPVLPAGLEADVEPWRSGRDTVKLPIRTPVPHDLVDRIVGAIAALPSR